MRCVILHVGYRDSVLFFHRFNRFNHANRFHFLPRHFFPTIPSPTWMLGRFSHANHRFIHSNHFSMATVSIFTTCNPFLFLLTMPSPTSFSERFNHANHHLIHANRFEHANRCSHENRGTSSLLYCCSGSYGLNKQRNLSVEVWRFLPIRRRMKSKIK